MLSRIRNSFKDTIVVPFDGVTQIDETYVGGKKKNKKKRVKNNQGRSLKTKVPVFGMICNGLVYTKVAPNTKAKTLKPIIRAMVTEGSTVVTDRWLAYNGLSKDYKYRVIKHNKGVYKMGPYHTNSKKGDYRCLSRNKS